MYVCVCTVTDGSLHLTVAELGGDRENMPPGTLKGIQCTPGLRPYFINTSGNKSVPKTHTHHVDVY